MWAGKNLQSKLRQERPFQGTEILLKFCGKNTNWVQGANSRKQSLCMHDPFWLSLKHDQFTRQKTERLNLDKVDLRQDEPIKMTNLESKFVTGEMKMHIPLRKTVYYNLDPISIDILL